MLIRPFRGNEDLQKIKAIYVDGLKDHPYLPQELVDQFAKELDSIPEIFLNRKISPKGTFLVLEVTNDIEGAKNQEIVGIVGLEYKSDELAELRKMSVLRTHRGKKYGMKLLESLSKYARSEGFKKIFLYTSEKSTAAIKLYEQWGFKVVETKEMENNHKVRKYEYSL